MFWLESATQLAETGQQEKVGHCVQEGGRVKEEEEGKAPVDKWMKVTVLSVSPSSPSDWRHSTSTDWLLPQLETFLFSAVTWTRDLPTMQIENFNFEVVHAENLSVTIFFFLPLHSHTTPRAWHDTLQNFTEMSLKTPKCLTNYFAITSLWWHEGPDEEKICNF